MIYSWSKFNYGQSVTVETQAMKFQEGALTYVALIPTGSYTLQEYVDAVADAFNAYGNQAYSVTLDRSDNRVTVTAPNTFQLLVTTTDESAYPTLGFTVDHAGAKTYVGDVPCGQSYVPQFKLQSYVSSDIFLESSEATINEAASGRVELVRFGVVPRMELEIKFISDLPMDDVVIRNNPNGLIDAVRFLMFATSKARIEFVPDLKTPGVVIKVLLEKTPTSSDGTGFKLKELFNSNVPDVYETGVLTFRVLND